MCPPYTIEPLFKSLLRSYKGEHPNLQGFRAVLSVGFADLGGGGRGKDVRFSGFRV